MEMKQMVYVVIENDYLTGVWNQYQDAASHCGEDGNIIPAVVDTYGERAACETPEEVIESMEQELQNLSAPYQDEDEEEDEEEDDDDMFSSFFNDDDEDDDEEEEDDDEDDEDEEDEDDDEDDDEANDIIRGLLNMLFD